MSKQMGHPTSGHHKNTAVGKNRIMIVVFSLVGVFLLLLTWFGVKATLLNPQVVNGTKTNTFVGEELIVVSNGNQGALSYQGMHFDTFVKLAYDEEKSTEDSVCYSNESLNSSMTITVRKVAEAYPEIYAFPKYIEKNALSTTFDTIRFAFRDDISKVNVFSPLSKVISAGNARQIRYMYAQSDDITYAEINGNLYGAVCYSTKGGVYVVDLVNNKDAMLYSMEIVGRDVITLSDVQGFLESVSFD